MPVSSPRKHDLSAEQHRALNLLAGSPNAFPMSLLAANGIAASVVVDLVRGLAGGADVQRDPVLIWRATDRLCSTARFT
jgi:hypothetical protein